MVIVRISGGTGNQLFQFATGLRLALKLNAELKTDKARVDARDIPYSLDYFNTTAMVATPEEIAPLKKICIETGLGNQSKSSVQDVLNYPDNIYLDGDFCNEAYFPDIRDILLKQITLKNPLSPIGEVWKKKILSAECSVSMHFRHGDFLYIPQYKSKPWFHVPPFDYYQDCLKALKQQYKNLTVFVFSNNMHYVKENLHLDVPTEFVEGWRDKERFGGFFAQDIEEMYLMSLCKHNINQRSAFSWWASYLNQNPDKKIFVSRSATAQEVKKYHYSLTINNNSPLDSDKWIYVPFDRDKQPDVVMRPIFSLLLVVNNDAANLPATLYSLLNQDYKYYEVIIIDNASTDGSDKICQDAVAGKKNATYKRLDTKVNNAAAWNEAFKAAQGKYVSFLKVGDRFLNNALTSLCGISYYDFRTEFFHMFSWLEENANGNIVFGDKKFSLQRDSKFKEEKRGSIMSKDGSEATRLLHNREINSFLSTKIYNSEFLKDNGIKFDETLADDEAENFFQAEAFSKSKYFRYQADALYVAPSQSGLCNEIISLEDQSKNRPLLTYQTHIGGKGWIDWLSEEQISGSTEDKKQIEAIKINFPNRKVYYAVYWNDKEGWSKEVTTSEMAGTTGKYKPIMGVAIWLDEADTKKFDIFYRVHKFDGSWTDWAKNGEAIYSHGVKLNAIQIKVATKSDKNSP